MTRKIIGLVYARYMRSLDVREDRGNQSFTEARMALFLSRAALARGSVKKSCGASPHCPRIFLPSRDRQGVVRSKLLDRHRLPRQETSASSAPLRSRLGNGAHVVSIFSQALKRRVLELDNRRSQVAAYF